jgi:hypothetical protein
MGPLWLWPVTDVQCKIQTHPLLREGALHEETSKYQTKGNLKSGNGPQRAAQHQDKLANWPSVANSTPTPITWNMCRSSLCADGLEYFHHSPCESLEVTERESSAWSYKRASLHETAKFGERFVMTWTKDWLQCRLHTCPLIWEGAPHIRVNKFSNQKKIRTDLIMGDTKIDWPTDCRL